VASVSALATLLWAERDSFLNVSASFPPGMSCRIAYNPTDFIQQSVNQVITMIFRQPSWL
jgi:hypothetical protein